MTRNVMQKKMSVQPTAKQVMEFRAATGIAVLASKEFLIRHPAELIARILVAASGCDRLPNLDAVATAPRELQDCILMASETKSPESSFLRDPAEDDPVLQIGGDAPVADGE
jgi:hypothetical protein